jgi:hypothetical protein
MRRLLVLFAIALLGGCSTTAVTADKATPIKLDRQVALATRSGDADATVVVTRDAGMMGSGCYMTFFVDGKPAARFETAETAKFFIPAGTVIFGVSLEGSGLCAMNPARREREFLLRAHDDRRFRLFMGSDGDADVLPTTL